MTILLLVLAAAAATTTVAVCDANPMMRAPPDSIDANQRAMYFARLHLRNAAESLFGKANKTDDEIVQMNYLFIQLGVIDSYSDLHNAHNPQRGDWPTMGPLVTLPSTNERWYLSSSGIWPPRWNPATPSPPLPPSPRRRQPVPRLGKRAVEQVDDDNAAELKRITRFFYRRDSGDGGASSSSNDHVEKKEEVPPWSTGGPCASANAVAFAEAKAVLKNVTRWQYSLDPRCANPLRYEQTRVFTWTLYDETVNGVRTNMTAHEFRAEIAQAFHVWSNAVANIRFHEVHSRQADLMLHFANISYGSVLAYAYASIPECNIAIDRLNLAEVRFSNNRTISWLSSVEVNEQMRRGGGGGVSFFLIALHEIGHAIGLPHCHDTSSIMFPVHKPSVTLGNIPWNFSLPLIDRLAIAELYTPSLSPSPPPPPPTRRNCEQSYSVLHAAADDDDRVDEMDFRTIAYLRFPRYDALATIRRLTFVFQGQQVWALNKRGHILPGYPTTLAERFNLPVLRVDAAYELTNGGVIFFSDQHFYVSNSRLRVADRGSLRELGLKNLTRVRDAFVVNGLSYLFDETCLRYWRLNEKTMLIELDFPRFLM